MSADAFQVLRFASVLSGETIQAGTNLVVNGGFETGDATGWTITYSGVFQPLGATSSAAPGFKVGTYYLQFDTTTPACRTAQALSDAFGVTAGTRYVFSLRGGNVVVPANPYGRIGLTAKLNWYDAGSALLSSSVLLDRSFHNSPVALPVASFLAPAGATTAKVQVNFTWDSSGPGTDPAFAGIDEVFVAAEVTRPFLPLIERLKHCSPQSPRAHCFSSLRYGHTDRGGYRDASFQIYGSPEYLNEWLEHALGQHLSVVYGSHGQVWEGLAYSLQGQIGGIHYALSLDPMANDVYLRYPTYNPYDTEFRGASRAEDAASIIRYGRKQYTEELNLWMSSEMGQARADQMLALSKVPRLLGIDSLGEEDADYLEVEASGYWSTVGWIQTNIGIDLFGASYDTAALIATLDGDAISTPRSALNTLRRNYGNLYLSADYSQVQTTGRLVGPDSSETDWRTGQGNFQQFIVDLADLGDVNGRRVITGVGDDQKFYLRTRPTTVAYQATRGKGGQLRLRDGGGAPCDPALVRSGNFLRIAGPRSAFTRASDPLDDPHVVYISEWSYDAENGTGQVLSPGSEPLDVLIGGRGG